MQFYNFNPRKFKFETHNLDPLERLVYRELIDEYTVFEKPLTTNLDDLAWRMGYKTDELKSALALVLDKFFVIKTLKKTGDKEPMYHHPRLDKELFAYWKNDKKNKNKNKSTNQDTNEVQTTTNDGTNKNSTDVKKAFLIESLKKQGVKANTRMRIGELQTLFDTHCKQTTNATNESTNTTNPVLAGNNQEPITINQEPLTNNNLSPQTPQGAGEIDLTALDKTDETTKTKPTKTQTAPKAEKTLNVPFETFWDEYDKKIDPKKCKPLWERLTDKDRLDAMAYIPRYKQAQPDKQFRKNPQTFLNARSWESEIIGNQPKQTPQHWGSPDDKLAVNQNWVGYDLSKELAELGITPINSTKPQQTQGVQKW